MTYGILRNSTQVINRTTAYSYYKENKKMNPKIEKYVFASRVLAVAVEGAVGDWAAYIGDVNGENHDQEQYEVARIGTKLPQEIAETIFPNWKHLRWRP